MRQKGILQISNPTANVTFSISGESAYPTKGQIINMDIHLQSRQYRVLDINGSIAKCISLYDTPSYKFASPKNTYANSTLDIYLNTTLYNIFNSTAKSAIVDTTFNQDSWYNSTSGNPAYKGTYNNSGTTTNYDISLGNSTYGSEITRHIYAPSVQDIIDYLDVSPQMTYANSTLNYANVLNMIWNNTPTDAIWLRTAVAGGTTDAWMAGPDTGLLRRLSVSATANTRYCFQIDLSKIAWS